jgi:hypothetical protein
MISEIIIKYMIILKIFKIRRMVNDNIKIIDDSILNTKRVCSMTFCVKMLMSSGS